MSGINNGLRGYGSARDPKTSRNMSPCDTLQSHRVLNRADLSLGAVLEMTSDNALSSECLLVREVSFRLGNAIFHLQWGRKYYLVPIEIAMQG